MALIGYQGGYTGPYKPEVKDYFSDLRKQIDAKNMVDTAKKEAEEAAKKAMGELPDLGPNGMYHYYGDVYGQMGQYLKDNKDRLLATEEGRAEYQNLLNGAVDWANNSKEYTKTTRPLLQRNMTFAQSGVNPEEWDSKGMRDSRTYGDYVNWTSGVDSARGQVGVKNGKWVITDDKGDHATNDESLFDLSYFDESKYLIATQPVEPRDFWSLGHDDRMYETRDGAVEWTAATVAQNSRASRDAVRWAEANGKLPEGVTAQQIIDDPQAAPRVRDAINAYAEAAVPEDWSPSDTSTSSGTTAPTTEQKRSTAFKNSIDATVTSEETVVAVDQAAGSQSIDVVNVADYSFPSEYRPNIDTSSFPEGSRIEDSDGIAVEIEGTHIIMTTGQIPVLVGANISDPIELTGQIESGVRRQIDELYGSGSYDRIIAKLREEAYSN